MENDIHVSHKGQGAATNREKEQGVTQTRADAAPCKNGLARTLSDYKKHNTAKVMIGIRPRGSISFVSKVWKSL
jgi:hypothetical protein